MADFCECSSVPLGSIKCGEFFDLHLLKKDAAPWR